MLLNHQLLVEICTNQVFLHQMLIKLIITSTLLLPNTGEYAHHIWWKLIPYDLQIHQKLAAINMNLFLSPLQLV